MSTPFQNQDSGLPTDDPYAGNDVEIDNFSDQTKIPIYWGPGQLTKNYPSYSPPDPKAWHAFDPLFIPQVVRFISGSNDDAHGGYDSTAYNPSSAPVSFYWKIINAVYHDPTYGGADMIYMQRFRSPGDAPQPEHAAFSINDLQPAPGGVFLHTFFQYGIGLKFNFIYPDGPAVDYYYLGSHGQGFYDRTSGHFYVPSH